MGIGGPGGFGETGDEDDLGLPLPDDLQVFQQLLGGAGVGVVEHRVLVRQMGAGDGLQVGVHHRMVVGQAGAEQVGALLGQEHGAPLSHAQHLIRRGEDIRRPADVVGPDQLQGLGHGVPVDDVELLAQLLNGVLRRDLALRRGGVHPSGGGVGDGQLEGVVAM